MTTKYIITFGCYDKDTHGLVKEPSAWQAVINEYVAQHFNGATVYSADGVYKHNDGTVVREPSIRVELCYTTREEAIALAKFGKEALNQESVMFEAIEEECDFI